MRFEIQTMSEDGKWSTVADKFQERTQQVRGSTRRMATDEVKRLGIHYILVQDRDWNVNDFRDDPESWGLKEVGKTPTANLYRIAP